MHRRQSSGNGPSSGKRRRRERRSWDFLESLGVCGLRARLQTAVTARYDAMIAAERASVKELEGLIADYSRKLVMARERLDALLASKSERVDREL